MLIVFMTAVVFGALMLYGGFFLELMGHSLRTDRGQLASWIQALIALGALGVTTVLLWTQSHNHVASRADEVDDELYRNVVSFAIIAELLVERVKQGSVKTYASESPGGPHFLLARLHEAPFYAFPNGRTLSIAVAIADHLSQLLQRPNSASSLLAIHDTASQLKFHRAVAVVEAQLRELRLAASDWTPVYEARRVRKQLVQGFGAIPERMSEFKR
ncbi:hypothetical protein ACFY89_29070 [Achromobacter spanius]|uniref:hypothetical protein n=1 Tax=Achromobacter spanius TaxID=217203 RepID=UPI0036E27980